MYDARLASLKAFFILELAKKYLYVATCTSEGTYNHLTYFRFHVLTPKLPCLTRFSNIVFETSVVKRVNSDQVSLVVTCTAARLYMSPSDNSG